MRRDALITPALRRHLPAHAFKPGRHGGRRIEACDDHHRGLPRPLTALPATAANAIQAATAVAPRRIDS